MRDVSRNNLKGKKLVIEYGAPACRVDLMVLWRTTSIHMTNITAPALHAWVAR